jgi:hypothetical protein
MAQNGSGQVADLSTLPDASAPGAGAASQEETVAAGARGDPSVGSGGIAARISALQTRFNGDLTQSLKALKADGSAFWWLAGVSFLYGLSTPPARGTARW